MKKISLVFTLLVGLVVLSCGRQEKEKSTPEPITIDGAKDWLKSQLVAGRIPNTAILDTDISWRSAFETAMKGPKATKVIVLPVPGTKEEKKALYRQIWVYVSEQGVKTGRIFEYYFNERVDKFATLEDFSGVIVTRDLAGDFLGGLNVKHNNIEGLVKEIEIIGKGKESFMDGNSGGKAKGWFCAPRALCNGWSIYIGATMVANGDCDTDLDCWWINSNYLEPAFTGYLIEVPSYNISPNPGPNGDPIEGPPSKFGYGFAKDQCNGYKYMLSAQRDQGVEIAGAYTKFGEMIMFPTINNERYKMKISDRYYYDDGRTIMTMFVGNPDPADPQNDYKYKDNQVYIEWYDYQSRSSKLYEITGFIHTHPIESGTLPHEASPEDQQAAKEWPQVNHYILTEKRLLKFDKDGNIERITPPCVN